MSFVKVVAPWEEASHISQKIYSDGNASVMDENERGFRLYRLWLTGILCPGDPGADLVGRRQFVNMWILRYVCSLVSQPYQDERVRTSCIRILARDFLVRRGSSYDRNLEVLTKAIVADVTGVTEKEAATFAAAFMYNENMFNAGVVEQEFWAFLRCLPPQSVSSAAKRLFRGPRAYRVNRRHYKIHELKDLLDQDPPNVGYDIFLHATMAAVHLHDIPLSDRLAFIFQVPDHVKFSLL